MKATSLQRTNGVLLCGILICVVLYYARQILIPVTGAALLAMLVTPFANWLEKKGIKRVWSTLLSVLLVLVTVSALFALVAFQAQKLSSDMPRIQQKTSQMIQDLQMWIESQYNVPAEEQMSFVKKQSESFLQSSGSFLRKTLSGITMIAGGLVLIIVFMFLLLYQREKYEAFILKLYKGNDPDKARQVLERTTRIAQYYLVGRLISIGILTALFTAGLMMVGVRNAFLLSLVAALLTIIPYIGSVVGGLFPFLVALVTEDSTGTAMWALGVVVFVQSIDNYFIEPYVVGGEVNISAFFTILILAVGGIVWGVAGMILFIPLLGIAKIVFDNVDELEPYGYLVGDQQEGRQSKRLWKKVKKLFGR
jgi:predicted PurR-regulated permease PerM